jgi:hypothetical protein
MKPLIEVTRELKAPHSVYLRYSRQLRAKTVSLDGDERYVNVDIDADGEVIGIELVFPSDQSFDLLAQFAHENGLGLGRVVIPQVA